MLIVIATDVYIRAYESIGPITLDKGYALSPSLPTPQMLQPIHKPFSFLKLNR